MERDDLASNSEAADAGLPAEVSVESTLARLDIRIRKAEQGTRDLVEGISQRFPEESPTIPVTSVTHRAQPHPGYINIADGE